MVERDWWQAAREAAGGSALCAARVERALWAAYDAGLDDGREAAIGGQPDAWEDGWSAGYAAARDEAQAVQVGSVSVSAGQAREVDAAREHHATRIRDAFFSENVAHHLANAILDAIADKRWQR
jgi:hypothetical protein